MTINNWDDTARSFKYVGLDNSDPRSSKGLFNPGQELEVYMGYQQPLAGTGEASALKLMMVGQVATLEQDFPSAGSPTLQIRAYNVLRGFLKQRHTDRWEDMKDSEIAQLLGRMPVSADQPGLGIEVRIDQASLAKEAKEPIVFMDNQFDLLFLLERASLHGYSIYMDEESVNGRKKRFLYFGPSDRDTFVTYKLEWGKSLIQFRPTLTTTKQVSQITIRGWDRRTKSPIEKTATWGDEGTRINLDLKELVKTDLQDRGDSVTNQPIYTPEQAQAMAKNLLLARLKEMVKASGSTVGLPDLRAGRTVQIGGLGKYFSGTYFITDTTHTIGTDGYRTTFNARREDESQQ